MRTESPHFRPSPPVTRRRLVRDLRGLGIQPGATLLVHSSLRSIGWVNGGPRAVVAALRDAVGPEGHVVIPTGTEANPRTSRAYMACMQGLTPDQVNGSTWTCPRSTGTRRPAA
jgi:aminoglycoside N3'-acetyltransferase